MPDNVLPRTHEWPAVIVPTGGDDRMSGLVISSGREDGRQELRLRPMWLSQYR